jgi:orotate phosphoribosyltransferase
MYGVDVRYCSNRKEAKDHGDAGILLGSRLKDGDRVVIIEDVTTSGKSIEETYPILQAQAKVDIKGLIVSLNRMEKGQGSRSAQTEIHEKYGFPVNAIVTMADVCEYLENQEGPDRILTDDLKRAIADYYDRYAAEEYWGLFH